MKKSKHTPTPWEHDSRPTKYDGIPFINWVIYGAKDGADDQCREIVDTFNASYLHDEETRAANAAFIVKAVNCHDDLLTALNDIKDEFERLKKATLDDEAITFIKRMQDACYLDGVLAVIDTKSKLATAKARGEQ